MKILIYHDLGAPSHYRALLHLLKYHPEVSVEFAEFAFVKIFAKSLLRRDWLKVRRSLSNALVFVKLIFGLKRPDLIILGIAPFDWRVVLIFPIVFFRKTHLHTSWPYWDGKFNAMNPRFEWVKRVWKFLIKNSISHVYFVTEAARKNFVAAGFLTKGSSIVRHSLDGEIYRIKKQRLNEGMKCIGYVGRLEHQKGLTIFLNLAKRMSGRYRFLVAGEGPMESDVAVAAKNGLVEFFGKITDQEKLSDFYNSLNFLLLPSQKTENWEELFGMVLIESVACGVFPLSTDHIGPIEVIRDMQVGLVFPEKDFEEMALSYLSNFPSAASPEKSARVKDLYSLDQLSLQWSACLSELDVGN